MPGPPPKPAHLRQRRNKSSTAATLPSEAASKTNKVPDLPVFPEPWNPMVVSWWKAVWQSPMAGEYLEADKHRLYKVAILHQEFWMERDPKQRLKVAAEIRQQEVPLGLTPIDRRRLQWEVEKAEEAEEKTQKRRKRREQAVAATKDPRDVLKMMK